MSAPSATFERIDVLVLSFPFTDKLETTHGPSMLPLNVSINGLARAIDVPPNRISAIINGKRAITADTALRLGKYFGASPGIWLDLQSDYGLRQVHQAEWPGIEARNGSLDNTNATR